jgi:hypothetical protein
MEKIIIYQDPLSDSEHKAHSISGNIRKLPVRYHLIDIIKDLKHGRPAENQRMMDEWIAMMELKLERGCPFSPEIVNGVWNDNF